MKICIIGTNFHLFPILDDLVEEMREQGEDITIVNWFARQDETFDCDTTDGFIFVDISPLKTIGTKPFIHLKRGVSEDDILEAVDDLSKRIYGANNESDTEIPIVKETLPALVACTKTDESLVIIESSEKSNTLQQRIRSFKFIIDEKEVELSKEDTDYLIRVFETAKENGYTLEKVIIDEKDIAESE